MKVFMTSSPMGAYRSTEAPAFKGLDPANGLVKELLSYRIADGQIRKVCEYGEVLKLA